MLRNRLMATSQAASFSAQTSTIQAGHVADPVAPCWNLATYDETVALP